MSPWTSHLHAVRLLGYAACALILCAAPRAHAAKLLVDGVVSVTSGLEGADIGYGTLEWQRQRLLLRMGAEWSSSETFREALGVYGLVELERSGAFGAELSYRRNLNKWLSGHAGLVGIFRPESLYGVNGGVAGNFDLGDSFGLFIDASAAAFPVGSDRPTSAAVVIWLSGGLGVRLHF